jgi:metal-responsive CopG/Arc/MetJ family transcriptional regulator
MKSKFSISIDEETLLGVEKAIDKGTFRNRSHAFEYAIKRVLGGEDGD